MFLLQSGVGPLMKHFLSPELPLSTFGVGLCRSSPGTCCAGLWGLSGRSLPGAPWELSGASLGKPSGAPWKLSKPSDKCTCMHNSGVAAAYSPHIQAYSCAHAHARTTHLHSASQVSRFELGVEEQCAVARARVRRRAVLGWCASSNCTRKAGETRFREQPRQAAAEAAAGSST